MTSSFLTITIEDETAIDIGNRGFLVDITQNQEWTLSFATESGLYARSADEYSVRRRNTGIFYVSGTVVEGGDIVTLSPDGDVPAEYRGKALAADAVVIIPEIFLKTRDQQGQNPTPTPDPTPEPTNPDGFVEYAPYVALLLHGDTKNPNFIDDSSYNRLVTDIGTPLLNGSRPAFGAGSIQLDRDAIEAQGLFTEIPADDETFTLEDASFTFEARLRFKNITGVHTLFSYGRPVEDTVNPAAGFFGLPLMVWEVRVDLDNSELIMEWTRQDSANRNDRTVLNIPFTEGVFTAKGEFQQTAFVYDKVKGHFAIFVDGNRVGFYDAASAVDPVWIGFTPFVKDTTETFQLTIGAPVIEGTLQNVGSIAARAAQCYDGLIDEVRLTLNEALYRTDSTNATLYNFAWPNPIVVETYALPDPTFPPQG